MCGGCVGRVKRLLQAQAGVTGASVNLATETALVRALLSVDKLDAFGAQLVQVCIFLNQMDLIDERRTAPRTACTSRAAPLYSCLFLIKIPSL